MTAASTSVKYFHSAMSGAPVLSGTAGALISIIDACLKDGFNLKTVDTLVVASGIATATISAGVGAFEADTVALIAGATPAGLNGEKRIIAVTASTITFDATGVSNQTATGTITAKLAPAGWDKPFSGTNLAAYRSADVTGTRMFLRVDDTGTTNARVVGYENMSDVNTGTGAFPTATQVSGGSYWPKANAANATARAWTLIADSKCVYLQLHTTTTGLGSSGVVVGFGDIASYKSGDPYSCFIHALNVDGSATTTPAQPYCLTYPNAAAYTYMPRSYTGLGTSMLCGHIPEAYGITSMSGSANTTTVPAYPNGPNNGLFFTRKLVYEPSVALRGVMKGLLHSPQNIQAFFNWRDKIDGQGEYLGRKLLTIKGGAAASTSSTTALMIDITGPWI